MTAFLYHTGCSVPADHVDADTYRHLLTIIPKSHPHFPSRKPVQIYEHSANGRWLRLPRAFAADRHTLVDKFDQRTAARPTFPSFKGQLKSYQNEAFEAVTSHLQTNGVGVVCLSTAFGKTYLALAIAQFLKRPVLIVVHLSLLLDQWLNIARELYPDAKINVWQGNKTRPEPDADIVIGMLQTVVRFDPSRMRDTAQWLPGFVIIDECHVVGADVFSKLFYRVQAPIMLGLTATPERQDGLESIVYAHLGPICYKGAIHREEQTLLVQFIRTPFIVDGHTDSERITKLAGLADRNILIMQKLQPLLEDTQRNILILCARCEQAEWFHQQLSLNVPDEVGLILSRNRQARALELEKRVICTTFQSFSTGVSKDVLNTLVFASPPRSRLIQALGRILRQHHGALSPTVLDVYECDDKEYKLKERQRVYRQQSNQMVQFTYHHPQKDS